MNKIIYDMPDADYRKADGVANSDLKQFGKSGLHYITAKTQPNEPTPSMLFGRAYHKAVFEPAEFEKMVAVMPEFAGTGSRKEKAEWVNAASRAGKIILKDDDYKTIGAMRAVIQAHPMASTMIAHGQAEVSAFWKDEEFDLIRKGRADFLPANSLSIVDLKTTEDAGQDAFSRTLYNFGYHQQAAYYLDLFNALRPNLPPLTHFCFIAQEKEAPYAVACYFLDAESIALGRRKYRKLLDRFTICQHSNKWTGYGDELSEIAIPKWAKKKEESGADVFYVLN